MSSTAVPGLGRVFRAELVLAVPPAPLQRELFERLEQMPRWVPTLGRVKVSWAGMLHATAGRCSKALHCRAC